MCAGAFQHKILVAQLDTSMQRFSLQVLSIQLLECTAMAAADFLQAQCMKFEAASTNCDWANRTLKAGAQQRTQLLAHEFSW